MKNKDILTIAKKKFNSRLIVGTGKYKNMSECAKAIKLSGAEIVTVAVRRVNILDKKKPVLMDFINPKKITSIGIVAFGRDHLAELYVKEIKFTK